MVVCGHVEEVQNETSAAWLPGEAKQEMLQKTNELKNQS